MRYVLGHLVVSEPTTRVGRECPTCGFDAVLDFPVHMLTHQGVTKFGAIGACVRCYEEESR